MYQKAGEGWKVRLFSCFIINMKYMLSLYITSFLTQRIDRSEFKENNFEIYLLLM